MYKKIREETVKKLGELALEGKLDQNKIEMADVLLNMAHQLFEEEDVENFSFGDIEYIEDDEILI